MEKMGDTQSVSTRYESFIFLAPPLLKGDD